MDYREIFLMEVLLEDCDKDFREDLKDVVGIEKPENRNLGFMP